jgi:hypothetical protein
VTFLAVLSRLGTAPIWLPPYMRHDLEAALPADLEGSADLVVEQE